jgi:DNA-binding beta-propeller fold protein YncE
VVVDLNSGATVARLPIGSGTDAAAFDPKRKLIFSSNGRDGTLSIIRESVPTLGRKNGADINANGKAK